MPIKKGKTSSSSISKSSKGLKGKTSKYLKKGGNVNSGVMTSKCNDNTIKIGESCFSLLHLLLVVGLIALLAFTVYIHFEERKQNRLLNQLQSGTLNKNDLTNEELLVLKNKLNENNKNKFQHDVNINIGHQPNNNSVSYIDQLHQKNHERIINPLLPPERSYVNTYGVPINIPSRGVSAGFQQVGMLHKDAITNTGETIGNNSDTVILPLYGRPIYPGAKKWNYYTTSDKYNMVKMPVTINGKKCDSTYGCDEIYSGDSITLPAYNGTFKVDIYDFDKPRYIPYVL